MPRPQRKRRVAFVPQFSRMIPEGWRKEHGGGEVVLTVDEAEAIRLADLEGLDQENAAIAMNVARTTFQRILHAARYKAAQCLILGLPLRVEGGSYEIKPCPECATEDADDCVPCQLGRHGYPGGRGQGKGRQARRQHKEDSPDVEV